MATAASSPGMSSPMRVPLRATAAAARPTCCAAGWSAGLSADPGAGSTQPISPVECSQYVAETTALPRNPVWMAPIRCGSM